MMVTKLLAAGGESKILIPTLVSSTALSSVYNITPITIVGGGTTILNTYGGTGYFAVSTNGTTWSKYSTPWSATTNPYAVYFQGASRFIAKTGDTLYYLSGTTWNACSGYYPSVQSTDTEVCAGASCVLSFNSENLNGCWIELYRSTDGISFTNIGNVIMSLIGVTTIPNKGCVASMDYINGTFIARAGNYTSGIWYTLSSTDGIAWGIKSVPTDIRVVGYVPGLYVGKSTSNIIYTSPDLDVWTPKATLAGTSNITTQKVVTAGAAIFISTDTHLFVSLDSCVSFQAVPTDYVTRGNIVYCNNKIYKFGVNGAYTVGEYPPYVL